MSDKKNEIVDPDKNSILDIAEELITGVPSPLRKNATTAFRRLCTALVDYPVAVLEGKTAEKRAETAARVELIQRSSRAIAENMEINPEYVKLAGHRFANKIVQEQINLDEISKIAAQKLLEQSKTNGDSEEDLAERANEDISMDWLNAFDDIASKMNSETMREYFGKILAGEINKPSSFSVKTLRTVSQLDSRSIELFKILCSLAISIRIPEIKILDARVVSMGNAANNSLAPYGLSYAELNILEEYGLIISELNSWKDYQMCVTSPGSQGFPAYFQGSHCVFVSAVPRPAPSELRLTGVALTSVGKELMGLFDGEKDPKYKEDFLLYIGKMNLSLQDIKVNFKSQ